MYAVAMSLRQAQKSLEKIVLCKFSTFLSDLDKDDVACLNEWVKERKPAGWIARVVKADGKHLNEKTLKRHLDGQCNCPSGTTLKGAYSESA